MQELHSIIRSCIENNQQHQKLLYEKYYGYALKIVFRYIYHYEKAINVVNDGYVKVFRSLHKFNCADQDHLEKVWMGWLKKIMINTAIDELRKNSMVPEIGDLSEQVWQQADNSLAADQNLLYKELVSQIKKLSPSYRVVFNMYVIDGFTHQEIARHLGISVGTSKSNLSKARMHLKKIIDGNRREADIYSL